jgi:hypothetical protein
MEINLKKVFTNVIFVINYWICYVTMSLLFLISNGGFKQLKQNSIIVFENNSSLFNPIIIIPFMIGLTFIFYIVPFIIASYIDNQIIKKYYLKEGVKK